MATLVTYQFPDEIRRKLPCSAVRRSTVTFLKLLKWVAPEAMSGFDFEGEFLRPGEWVTIATLPRPAVLLECAGVVTVGRGHNRSEMRYVVWRFDFEALEWIEMAWCNASGSEWAPALRGVACRALEGDHPAEFNCSAVLDRIKSYIQSELRVAPILLRAQVFRLLHDWIAAGIVR